MTDESDARIEHVTQLMREIDHLLVRREMAKAYDLWQYAHQILLAEMLAIELDQMRREIANAEN